MARQVIWSADAIADLAAIVGYIAADRPIAAEKFGLTVLTATRKLADFPLAGRVVPELRDATVREIIVEPYRIIYEVNTDSPTVDILRVWHAARGRPEM